MSNKHFFSISMSQNLHGTHLCSKVICCSSEVQLQMVKGESSAFYLTILLRLQGAWEKAGQVEIYSQEALGFVFEWT